ncbi:MAG: hypothetical protein H0W89_07690 [Candidatus Levybacteria bacterium]|nr:hypothetical protein [Candidatus Levybacteria bacterium]
MAEETGASTPKQAEIQKVPDGIVKDISGPNIAKAISDRLTDLRDLADGKLVEKDQIVTRPKAPEDIQAQVAAFTAETVGDDYDKDHIFNNIGDIASGRLVDVKRVTNSHEYHTDENGTQIKVPEGTERTAATAEEYLKFLRSVDGSKYEPIQGRADILRAYSHFEPTIARLKDELDRVAALSKDPAFVHADVPADDFVQGFSGFEILGRGSSAHVFKITEDDKNYAVRVLRDPSKGAETIDRYVGGTVLVKGVSHFEQIVAASYKDGVTIAEIPPGKEVGGLTVEETYNVSDEQLGELVDTLIIARERGIGVDPKPSNFFYDPEDGYTIIDIDSDKERGKDHIPEGLGSVVGQVADMIANRGFYTGDNSFKSTTDFANDLPFVKAQLNVLKRYKAVVERKLDGDELQAALKKIDRDIVTEQTCVDNYSDPQWVAHTIAQGEEWMRPKADPEGWTDDDNFV